MLELLLERDQFDAQQTIGSLSVNGAWECWTLEDAWRVPGVKIDGATCIPSGRYEIVWTFSKRFKVFMPLLVDVHMFDGIRIHPGNTDADTRGCILPGQTRSVSSIGRSRLAYEALAPKIELSCQRPLNTFITIKDLK